MTEDVKIIGRSNTAKNKDMTTDELKAYFSYGTKRSWNTSSCYYQFYSSRGTQDFLGYRHSPTGIIFSHKQQRSDTMGSTIYNLSGVLSSKIIFPNDYGENGFDRLKAEMDAVDSKRKNWDIVRMSVKPKHEDTFFNLYLTDGNSRIVKGDLSMLFDVDEVLQKGCKNLKKQMSVDVSEVKIEQTNKIKEMII